MKWNFRPDLPPALSRFERPFTVVNHPSIVLLPATRRDGEAIAALFTRQHLLCRVCVDAAEAAQAIGEDVGVLVLTDHMVMLAGAHLIMRAMARQPVWSDVPVVFLGKAGRESREMADFLGHLTNVTLLDRPATTRTLLSAVQAALRSRHRQYQLRDQIAALQNAENELRLADQRKDEFLAMLAHELRNPLAPIRTAIELLPQLIDPANLRTTATLGVLKRQTRQLTRLVDDLLDVSRVTQGRIEIQRVPVELSGIIAQALESVQTPMDEKRHTVTHSITPGIYVDGDDARLVQCVSNVLMNAAKYTDPGGTISLELTASEQQAIVSISDTGIGIPQELLPRIFDLFVQDSRSLDRSQGGLGIGLCVVRRLIEMHGGEVHAASSGTGRGSRFDIVLPRVPAPGALPRTNVPAAVGVALKILIVDDNRDAADSLALLLSSEGHAVEAVYTPDDALSLAPRFSPQVVLLDIGLPGMDGYEVARRLRSARVMAYLVALTGYGQREDIERSRSAGFDAHLVKPVDFVQLDRVLGDVRPFAGA